MNLISKFFASYREKKRLRESRCSDYLARIETSLQEASSLFENRNSFIQPDRGWEWYRKNAPLLEEVKEPNVQQIKGASNYKQLQVKQKELYALESSLQQRIGIHNEQVALTKIQGASALLGDVEGRKLDVQQMMCIVMEAHNQLVIAGAGTGKTTTIIGKIKFLLKSGMYKPEDILVLSFTNVSADEMCQRISRETGCKIEAVTFHKLGVNIITSVEGVKPQISQLDMSNFIKQELQKNIKSAAYLKMLNSYLLYNRVVAKSEFEFKTMEEYREYLSSNPPTTLNNEKVKSYGEMDIANFLMRNGVNYIYEQPYEVDTRTSEYAQYTPDFYLPDYHIYIEYFGINKQGEVPSYFQGSHGMSASQSYQASMHWKREIHKANHTVLVECYAYEKFDDVLLDNLQRKLLERGVKFLPKSEEELWKEISDRDDSALKNLIDLFQTVIHLIKSNGYNIQTVRQLNMGNRYMKNNNMILSLIEPIFDSYCAYLKEHNEIDFNDMIHLAKGYVETGRFVSPYKYVIVDEYQDISKARFSLLYSMRKSNNFDLFCVGDDWQSIYRFSGSDIGFILNFERYWGATQIGKIETTYRFSQELIEISGRFIMQNPVQIKKSLKGRMAAEKYVLGEIYGYTETKAIEFMVQKLEDLPKGSSVFFIGRYSFDVELLKNNAQLDCHFDNSSNVIDVKYNKRPDLQMSFLTAHKAKGLQADYVFIINNKRLKMGFPSQRQDDAILNLLLEGCDEYPYAEERRLYYVALTRAKRKVFLVTIKDKESEFALTLKKWYAEPLQREKFTCPICGGQLIKRTGSYGEFWGCSNYRTMRCTYTRKGSPK